MKIIALGSPGVGKGTYATEIVKKYGLLHISTGDLFRENIKNETELGLKAKEYMDAGKLVPDEITIAMAKERLSRDDVEKGFILDGFPRTIPQAEALSEFAEIDFALNFKADEEVILQRLGGRWTCKKCGAIFHEVNLPPKQAGVCDECSGELYQREDQQPEVIKERLRIYEEQTAPLINYYQEKGKLKEVSVNEDFGKYKDLLMGRIFKVIDEK